MNVYCSDKCVVYLVSSEQDNLFKRKRLWSNTHTHSRDCKGSNPCNTVTGEQEWSWLNKRCLPQWLCPSHMFAHIRYNKHKETIIHKHFWQNDFILPLTAMHKTLLLIAMDMPIGVAHPCSSCPVVTLPAYTTGASLWETSLLVAVGANFTSTCPKIVEHSNSFLKSQNPLPLIFVVLVETKFKH